MREWGIEQIVRDSRVAMIYEGTNEIQAQDLLFRKVLADQGAALLATLTGLEQELQELATLAAARALAGLASLRELLAQLGGREQAKRLYPVAGDFLRATTLVLMAWAWARLEAAAADGNGAQAFARWVWPELAMRIGMVRQALSDQA